MAEKVFDARALPANALCFHIAFFIGGGLMLDGHLFTGATGHAAGFGSLRVPDLKGVAHPLIDLASLGTFENTLREAGYKTQQMWADPESWDFPAAIVEPWVTQCANAIAKAIRSTQIILDLDAVLIDGWMPSDLCAALTNRISVDRAALDVTGMHSPDVVAGTLGADARILGASSLPLSHRFLVQ